MPGDKILSKPEGYVDAPVRVQTVEETFRLEAPTLQLHVGGQIIETTAEHPFYVDGKGWTDGCDLQPGDLLIGAAGNKIAVESIVPTGETKPVFNIRVSQDHTYFVGDDDWGCSIWVHNQYSVNKATGEVFHTAEDGVKTLTGHITKTADGKAVYQSLKEGAEPKHYGSLQDAYEDVPSGMANGVKISIIVDDAIVKHSKKHWPGLSAKQILAKIDDIKNNFQDHYKSITFPGREIYRKGDTVLIYDGEGSGTLFNPGNASNYFRDFVRGNI